MCTYLRGEGLGRQLVLCLCLRRRPWAAPCASSSPWPSEVPSSGFICEVQRLQEQHTYRERPALAARRWRTPLNVIFLKRFLTQRGASSSSAQRGGICGKRLGRPAGISGGGWWGFWAGMEQGKMRNSIQASFLGSAEGGLSCLPTPVSFPQGNSHFGFVMWVSSMGGEVNLQPPSSVRVRATPCSPGCRQDNPPPPRETNKTRFLNARELGQLV